MTTTIHQVGEFLSTATSSEVDHVIALVNARRKTLRAMQASLALSAIKAGDQVKLKGLSPKYLNGLVGTVTSVDGAKFLVDMGITVGRFGRNIHVPATAVELVW